MMDLTNEVSSGAIDLAKDILKVRYHSNKTPRALFITFRNSECFIRLVSRGEVLERETFSLCQLEKINQRIGWCSVIYVGALFFF